MDIFYHPKVKSDDIPRISTPDRKRIARAIEQRLAIDPDKFGLPLRRGLHGYRKFRVGDYRVIYRVEKHVIRIIIIGHRKDVYDKSAKRL